MKRTVRMKLAVRQMLLPHPRTKQLMLLSLIIFPPPKASPSARKLAQIQSPQLKRDVQAQRHITMLMLNSYQRSRILVNLLHK